MILIFVKLCCIFFRRTSEKSLWKNILIAWPVPYDVNDLKHISHCVTRAPLLFLRRVSLSSKVCREWVRDRCHPTKPPLFFQFKRHTSPILTLCQQELTSTTLYCLSTIKYQPLLLHCSGNANKVPGWFSVMWVSKVLLPPLEIRIFVPKTAIFAPKYALYGTYRPCLIIWCPVGW